MLPSNQTVRWQSLTLALSLSVASLAQAQTTTPFACTAGKSYILQDDPTSVIEVNVATGAAGAASAAVVGANQNSANIRRVFAAVGRVAGHQTTTQAKTYSFVDAAPGPEATHYYRLRQVALDGTSTLSPVRVVGLAAGSSPVQLAVAPNPTPSHTLRVQVQYAGPAAVPATLTVQSLLGQTVLTQPVTLRPGTNELVPGGVLAPGAYWLSLRGAAVGQHSQRLLVSE
ncbi:MAG: hypothetical protein EOO36_01990 [Cytophagaceae bacterium]|nr:MAG: hypothetical protein EOO36_01990 [Cytophagaceae bacterium]